MWNAQLAMTDSPDSVIVSFRLSYCAAFTSHCLWFPVPFFLLSFCHLQAPPFNVLLAFDYVHPLLRIQTYTHTHSLQHLLFGNQLSGQWQSTDNAGSFEKGGKKGWWSPWRIEHNSNKSWRGMPQYTVKCKHWFIKAMFYVHSFAFITSRSVLHSRQWRKLWGELR